MTIEEKWGQLIYTGSVSREAEMAPKMERWLGINVTSQGARLRGFWEDVFRVIREYWNITGTFERTSRNHIYFEAVGPFGSEINVLVEGPLTGEFVDFTVSVKKQGTVLATKKKRFSDEQNIRQMIEWVDLFAVSITKPLAAGV